MTIYSCHIMYIFFIRNFIYLDPGEVFIVYFFCFYSLLHIFKEREYAHALARPYCILCINTIPKESLLSIYGLSGWALNGGKDQDIQQISICIILSLISIQMHFYFLFLATHDSPQQALTEGNRTLHRPLQVVRKNHANHF